MDPVPAVAGADAHVQRSATGTHIACVASPGASMLRARSLAARPPAGLFRAALAAAAERSAGAQGLIPPQAAHPRCYSAAWRLNRPLTAGA